MPAGEQGNGQGRQPGGLPPGLIGRTNLPGPFSGGGGYPGSGGGGYGGGGGGTPGPGPAPGPLPQPGPGPNPGGPGPAGSANPGGAFGLGGFRCSPIGKILGLCPEQGGGYAISNRGLPIVHAAPYAPPDYTSPAADRFGKAVSKLNGPR